MITTIRAVIKVGPTFIYYYTTFFYQDIHVENMIQRIKAIQFLDITR